MKSIAAPHSMIYKLFFLAFFILVFAACKKDHDDNNPIVNEATEKYASDLQSNHGLDATQATEVAGRVVPQTMNELAAKTNDPGDSRFNIQDIFNKLSGGKTGGMNIQSMLNKFGGGKLDKDGDGDVDLQDLQSMFADGSGIMDKVKGMFN